MPVLLAIGTFAGVYSGMFGVGGGTVMVPLMILWLGLDPRAATATSLAAIAVIATAGTAAHAAYGNVHFDAALIAAVPAVIGALIGTSLQQKVPKNALSIGLALLMLIAAADMLRESLADASSVTSEGGEHAIEHAWVLLLAGLAAGTIGAMVGIGGGTLLVPALIYAAGLGQRAAVATSLAAMIAMSIVAAWRQQRHGNLLLRAGITVGACGIAGAAVGATLAEVLPEQLLRIAFALLLTYLAVQMLRRVRADRSAAARAV